MNLKYTIIFLVLLQSYVESNVIRNKRYTLNNNSEEVGINNRPIIGKYFLEDFVKFLLGGCKFSI